MGQVQVATSCVEPASAECCEQYGNSLLIFLPHSLPPLSPHSLPPLSDEGTGPYKKHFDWNLLLVETMIIMMTLSHLFRSICLSLDLCFPPPPIFLSLSFDRSLSSRCLLPYSSSPTPALPSPSSPLSLDDGAGPDKIAHIMGPPDRCEHAASIINELLQSIRVREDGGQGVRPLPTTGLHMGGCRGYMWGVKGSGTRWQGDTPS